MSAGHIGNENLFSGFAADYERMINWNERLVREAPFFKKLFADAGAGKVLDTACGTGRHAIMFCLWGLTVAASDISPEMISVARENALAAGCQIEFQAVGLEELDKVFQPGFDAVTCMGNSLPHIRTRTGLVRAFSAISNLLKNSGLFALQIRNYRRVYARNEKFMPLNARAEGGREYLYLRMNELGEDFVTFNIIIITRDEAGKWSFRVESEKLAPWTDTDIEAALNEAGLAVCERYGNFAFGPYKPLESTDLVVIARKGLGSRR